jgi:hypothetical protein
MDNNILSVQQNLVDAIETIVNAALAKQSRDVTIVGKITRVKDIEQGIYVVQYEDLYFDGYAAGAGSYAVEDAVYVLIPQNNFANKKIILNKAEGDMLVGCVKKEVTQAEYDALPPSKNTDGIIYFISDSDEE